MRRRAFKVLIGLSLLPLSGCAAVAAPLLFPGALVTPGVSLNRMAPAGEHQAGSALHYTGGVIRSVAPNIPGLWTVSTPAR